MGGARIFSVNSSNRPSIRVFFPLTAVTDPQFVLFKHVLCFARIMSTLCPNSCRQTARTGQLPPLPPVPYAYASEHCFFNVSKYIMVLVVLLPIMNQNCKLHVIRRVYFILFKCPDSVGGGVVAELFRDHHIQFREFCVDISGTPGDHPQLIAKKKFTKSLGGGHGPRGLPGYATGPS